MTNTTNNKKEYINRWNSHIDDLCILAFCSDEKLSKEIMSIRDRLKVLVRKIVEIKHLH